MGVIPCYNNVYLCMLAWKLGVIRKKLGVTFTPKMVLKDPGVHSENLCIHHPIRRNWFHFLFLYCLFSPKIIIPRTVTVCQIVMEMTTMRPIWNKEKWCSYLHNLSNALNHKTNNMRLIYICRAYMYELCFIRFHDKITFFYLPFKKSLRSLKIKK